MSKSKITSLILLCGHNSQTYRSQNTSSPCKRLMHSLKWMPDSGGKKKIRREDCKSRLWISFWCTFLVSLKKARGNFYESYQWEMKATEMGTWGNKAVQCTPVNQDALNREICLIEMFPKEPI